jgi:hypothetical protein
MKPQVLIEQDVSREFVSMHNWASKVKVNGAEE